MTLRRHRTKNLRVTCNHEFQVPVGIETNANMLGEIDKNEDEDEDGDV